MEYKVGDIVRFRDSVGIAVVSRIIGNIIYIKDDSGFEHEYQRHELLPFQTMEIADVSIKDEKISIVEEKSLEMQMIDAYNAGLEELEKNDVIYAARKFNEAELLYPQSIWAPRAALMAEAASAAPMFCTLEAPFNTAFLTSAMY